MHTDCYPASCRTPPLFGNLVELRMVSHLQKVRVAIFASEISLIGSLHLDAQKMWYIAQGDPMVAYSIF